jgi:AAA+ superfamily predicted ATPase
MGIISNKEIEEIIIKNQNGGDSIEICEDEPIFDPFVTEDGMEFIDNGDAGYAPTTKNQYKSRISHVEVVNKPIMAIFFNYFNILSHKRINNNIDTFGSIKFKGNLDGEDVYIDYFPDFPPILFTYKALLSINGNDITFVMTAFKDGREVRNIIRISSLDTDMIKSYVLYETLFKNAVDMSNLKGSYLTISDKVLEWKVRELKELSFDDVFLPEDLMIDLNLYTQLFKTKNILQRYMFSGIPGTGKTESTRAISKILNNIGVTIIKTNICEIINQKFELAKILAPCVVILDDIDLYLGDRNHGGTSPLLGAFLDILDGVDKLPSNVGVIASTNAPHLIDLAAQRPGRFNKLLFFDELTIDNVKNIIKKSLTLMNNEFNNVSDKDIKILSNTKLTEFFKKENYTGADIFETIRNVKHKSDILETKLDIDKIIAEITKNKNILDKKLKTTRIENKLRRESGRKIGY